MRPWQYFPGTHLAIAFAITGWPRLAPCLWMEQITLDFHQWIRAWISVRIPFFKKKSPSVPNKSKPRWSKLLAEKRKKRRSPSSLFGKPLLGLVALTLSLYLLRGWKIITFLPGGIFLGMAALTLLVALLYGLEVTNRWQGGMAGCLF